MQINRILLSKSNGPGKRYTIWVQGCSIHCKYCINPDTWDFDKGETKTVQEIIDDIKSKEIDGITITGGEPLDQYREVLPLCESLFKDYNIFLTTGYDYQRLKFSYKSHLLKFVDILVSGPYEFEKYTDKELWRGSTNQELHYLTERGKQAYEKFKDKIVKAEVFINPDGSILATGFSIPQNLLQKLS